MRWFGLCLLLPVMVLACKSVPVKKEALASDGDESARNSITVSKEMYDLTLAEVRLFVNNLNSLINTKDYSGWKNALSDEFYAVISSPEFLTRATESDLLKSRKIVLKTPNDYFLQVVVPSRKNSQVDEIEFTAENTVKVYYLEERTRKGDNNTDTTEIRRLRLYEIRKSENGWKIIN